MTPVLDVGDPATSRRYRNLFCPRIDDYAYWSGSSWLRARAPLTIDAVAMGLRGQPSISSYMMNAEGTTHVLALDFDTDDADIEKARHVAAWTWAHGVAAYLEPSRGDRAHLWVTLNARIPASVAQRFLVVALRGAGLDPGDPHIERFPTSDRAPRPGDVGRCLRLPMVPNPKDGVGYPLLDPRTMESPDRTFERTVAAIVQAPTSRVIALAGPEPAPVERVDRSGPEHIRAFNQQWTVSEVLEQLWGISDAEAGRSICCPAHDDVHPSLSIFADNRRVLCYSPDCVLHNDGRGRDAYDLFIIAPTPAASQ